MLDPLALAPFRLLGEGPIGEAFPLVLAAAVDYTEPANRSHFAETRDEPVIVQINGMGPSSTRYVDPATDPRRGAGSP